MITTYSLYENNLTYFIFCYRNCLYISAYHNKTNAQARSCNPKKAKMKSMKKEEAYIGIGNFNKPKLSGIGQIKINEWSRCVFDKFLIRFVSL
jgi:hypothetical protein